MKAPQQFPSLGLQLLGWGASALIGHAQCNLFVQTSGQPCCLIRPRRAWGSVQGHQSMLTPPRCPRPAAGLTLCFTNHILIATCEIIQASWGP